MTTVRFIASIAILVGVSLQVPAAEDQTNYDEPGLNPGREHVAHSFAERIDPFTGNLSLQYVDLWIPGNAGFDLKVQRSYNSNAINGTLSPFGRGWQMHFGRVSHGTLQSCSGATTASLTLERPDGSRETLHKSNGVAGTAASTDYLTTSFWKGQCISGGGIAIFSPDGTRYDMTADDGSYFSTTKITDKWGNFANVTYTLNAPTGLNVPAQISANDGRAITFSYGGGKLLSVTGGGTTWSYTVSTATDGSYQLTGVTRPTGGNWTYSYNGNLGTQPGSFALQRVNNPFNGIITYGYAFVNFLPASVGSQPQTAVVQKTAGSDSWTYAYTPSLSTGTDDTTTVTLPNSIGQIVYRHFGYSTVGAGEVWKIGLLHQKSTGTQQTETLTWSSQAISTESISRPGYFLLDTQVNRPLLSQRTINLDGATYTTSYSSLDAYGNPQTISETGNRTKTTTLTYFNSTPPWIVGVADDETISGVGTISRSLGSVGQVLSELRYGVMTSFTYNGDGTISSMTSAKPSTTTYSSYSHGIPQVESRPEGVTIQRSVDAMGNIISQTDGEFTWQYGYDGLGRMTLIDFPIGSSATITYTATSKTLNRGSLTETTQFDPFGNPSSVTRAGVTSTFDYDGMSRKTFESLPGSGSGTTITYDTLGRVTRTVSPAGTRTFTFSSGSTTVTNERGFSTRYDYDRYGDPAQTYLTGISPPVAAAAVTMSRDPIGTLLSATQNGVTRTYNYDSHFFLTSTVEPEVGTTTYGRDGIGNMTSRTVGSQQALYTYDGLSRLSTISGTGVSVSLGYNARSKVTSVNDGAAGRTFTYDSNGNRTQDTLTIDGQTFTVGYTYDSIDGLASITYPKSKGTVTYAPDALGRPTEALPFVNSIAYLPSGNLSSMSFANGISQTYGEDSDQRPNSVTAQAAQLGLNYSYDPVGNVGSITNSYFASENRTLGYDSIDRLTSASGPWGNGSISYDGGGNILSQQFGTYGINYQYSANRLSILTGNGITTRNYTYDGAGNITGNGQATFGFDVLSQMTCMSCGTGSEVQYQYDGQGKRVSQDVGGNRTYFIHAVNGDLLFEYTPYGLNWTRHAYVHGKRVASEVGSDALVSSTALSASPTNPAFGDTVTLTASVAPLSATGSVQFLDGSQLIGTATLSSGQASISIATLSGTTHSITASYLGDANYQPSVSTPVSVVVGKHSSATTLAASPSSGSLGQTVALSATVTGSSPTGTVQFSDGGTVLGTAAIANGTATFTTGPLAVGTHSFTATYQGDQNNLGSSSAAASAGISQGSPTVTVASSNTNATVGTSVVFTATVNGVTGISPTGSITFMDRATAIGTVTCCNAGLASLSISNLAIGTHTISASYSGDANYLSAASASITQTIHSDFPSVNVALASNGGVVSASSTNASYTLAAVNNGDRTGANITSNIWVDDTPDVFPDWVRIDFAASQTIDHVVVYSVQDNYTSPIEPTDTLTFTSLGLTAFDVQGWNGSSWVTLGSVAGNNLVKRTVSFPATTVSAIRVMINNSLLHYSRVVEIEAWTPGSAPPPPSSVNAALASNGGVVSASSTNASYTLAAVNNGDRTGANITSNIWVDDTPDVFPDWVRIDFAAAQTIDHVVVYSVQDNYTSPIEPTDTLTFTSLGLTAFDVQGWNGSSWVTLGSVAGNNLVKRTVSFPATTVSAIRVMINNSLLHYSRVVEIEAWTPGSAPPPPSSVNAALASNGGVVSASSTNASYTLAAVNNGDRTGANITSNIWVDDTPDVFPDWVRIDFAAAQTIDHVVVYSVQDNYTSPIEPTDTLTFTSLGLTAFDVQGWNGSSWVTLGSVAGNNLVKRTVSFPATTVSAIRVMINNSLLHYSRVVEIEAWSAP